MPYGAWVFVAIAAAAIIIALSAVNFENQRGLVRVLATVTVTACVLVAAGSMICLVVIYALPWWSGQVAQGILPQ